MGQLRIFALLMAEAPEAQTITVKRKTIAYRTLLWCWRSLLCMFGADKPTAYSIIISIRTQTWQCCPALAILENYPSTWS
jgi:hypothetical protein